MPRCALTVAVLVLAGFSGTTAQAAVVSVAPNSRGDDTLLVVRAAGGERNRLVIGGRGQRVMRVSDAVPLTPGARCVSMPTETPTRFVVECNLDGPAFTIVDAGDEDDSVLAGSEDGQLFGGPGDDFLDPGAGQDLVVGQSGDDEIRISGAGTKRISGGSGADLVRGVPSRPLGSPNSVLAVPTGSRRDRMIVRCTDAGDRVLSARFGDTLRGCTAVDAFQGLPRERARRLLVRTRCPDRVGDRRGGCDVRISVGGRGVGRATASVPVGRTTTVLVPLDNINSERAEYRVRLTATVRTTKGRGSIRSAWTVRPAA